MWGKVSSLETVVCILKVCTFPNTLTSAQTISKVLTKYLLKIIAAERQS